MAVKVEEENRTGCKLCIPSCPDPNVLLYVQETRKVAVNQHRCKGCGFCVTVCPQDALAVSSL